MFELALGYVYLTRDSAGHGNNSTQGTSAPQQTTFINVLLREFGDSCTLSLLNSGADGESIVSSEFGI